MAIHTTLPIYKVAYDLLALVTALSKNMPRDFKNSMGGKLRDECLEISIMIFKANVAQDKTPYLDDLIERVQVAELLLRLAQDMRLISVSQYAKAIKLTESVGKQATGWRNKSARPVSSRSRP